MSLLRKIMKENFYLYFFPKKWALLLPFAYIFIIAVNFELLSFSYEGSVINNELQWISLSFLFLPSYF